MKLGRKDTKLEPKILSEYIFSLFAGSPQKNYAVGNGILTNMKIGFNEEMLIKNKNNIARILQAIGVDEKPLISLSSLTTLKNGDVWNKVEIVEEFKALELLLACSDACGFIINNRAVIQTNIITLGEINSIIISGLGRASVGDDDKWLQLIRESVLNEMHFITDPDSIKECATAQLNNKKSI